MAFGLDSLMHDTIGISSHSIVVGALASAGCLGVVCVFASISRHNTN
jgi:hypothetical protein